MQDTRRTVVAALAGVLAAVLLVVLAASSASAASPLGHGDVAFAQNNSTTTVNYTIANSDYYQNGSKNVSSKDWFSGIDNASLDSLGRMATRFGAFFIGNPGDLDQSGTGFKGALLTGLIMAVGLVGAISTVGVGPVGGSVFAVVIGYGLTAVGLAPEWFKILLLFAVGSIAFVALARVLEAR